MASDEEGFECWYQTLPTVEREKTLLHPYPMVAEDDVDMESLQAQIDMDMSFAQNLVTSWIKPTHLAQLRSSGVNAAQILEEELRRPPRLGVGASVPAAPSLAHETSKLKRKLGRNGAKGESVAQSQVQDPSKSDDEEHKGRPAKRKTKVDPFRHGGSKKKRKADSETNLYPAAEKVSNHSVSLPKNLTLAGPPKHDSSSGKETQRIGSGDQRSCVTEEQQSTPLISSSPVSLPIRTTFTSSPTAPTASISKPSREIYAPVLGPTTSESGRVHTNPMPLPDKANSLGIPLLNLDGPPELTDKPGSTGHMNNSRRKRKRRKKKKTQTIAGTGDNLH